MKIFTCISAFFLFSIAYAQQGNNQERLDQMPPAVTEKEVERDAKLAGEERVSEKKDKKEKKESEKAGNTTDKKEQGETPKSTTISNRKSSNTP